MRCEIIDMRHETIDSKQQIVGDCIEILLTNSPLNVTDAETFVKSENCGGVVTFTGMVRNATKGKRVLHLAFEAYEPMAIKEMQKIAKQALAQFSIERIAIHHGLGIMPVGGIPVIISVASPHRDAAFEACEFAINSLKETVPIWKKEFFEDGEVWVSATP